VSVGATLSISRRTFLKASVAGGVGISALGFDLRPAYAAIRQLKVRNARECKTVCPKGASQMQLAISPRLRKSLTYREAGSSEWREVDWDFAMDWFARKFKESRHT
jgi:anaerobic selenocysteine-containing dehydrogenase